MSNPYFVTGNFKMLLLLHNYAPGDHHAKKGKGDHEYPEYDMEDVYGGFMHEKIADIQNSFWKAYKNFKETMDVNQWADEVGIIMEKYRHDKQPLCTFCENQLYGWSAVLSVMRVNGKIGEDKI